MSLDIHEQYDKIYRYCYFKVNNRCLAEDLMQETFLRYVNGLSVREICNITGLSRSSEYRMERRR